MEKNAGMLGTTRLQWLRHPFGEMCGGGGLGKTTETERWRLDFGCATANGSGVQCRGVLRWWECAGGGGVGVKSRVVGVGDFWAQTPQTMLKWLGLGSMVGWCGHW